MGLAKLSAGVIFLALFRCVELNSMGEVDPKCDNARTRLHNDWDFSKVNYTCTQEITFAVQQLQPLEECFQFRRFKHICTIYPIKYPDTEPVYGNHRPYWAVYGEYKFLPAQRWVHNLEHGAIVMLYHPCADLEEVEKLRQIVSSCNSRHIITAHNFLPQDRPLALVAYGCRLYMSTVDQAKVAEFMKNNAMKAPESQETREGIYDLMLVRSALDLSRNQKHTNTHWCANV